jgi:hypothetical protein
MSTGPVRDLGDGVLVRGGLLEVELDFVVDVAVTVILSCLPRIVEGLGGEGTLLSRPPRRPENMPLLWILSGTID